MSETPIRLRRDRMWVVNEENGARSSVIRHVAGKLEVLRSQITLPQVKTERQLETTKTRLPIPSNLRKLNPWIEEEAVSDQESTRICERQDPRMTVDAIDLGTWEDTDILDDEEDARPRHKPRRNLYGSLHPAGRPWVSMNIGLLMVMCTCGGRREIQFDARLDEIVGTVGGFSDLHARCGPNEKTGEWRMPT